MSETRVVITEKIVVTIVVNLDTMLQYESYFRKKIQERGYFFKRLTEKIVQFEHSLRDIFHSSVKM